MSLPTHPPASALDGDVALLRLRRDAADRWLYRHAAHRKPAPARDARHLGALSQAGRHLASLQPKQGDQGASEIERFLEVVARRVRDRAAEEANACPSGHATTARSPLAPGSPPATAAR